MNRQEFLRRLEYLLSGIPENERMDALAYYQNYFDEAGVENEQKAISELRSPEHVAQTILADFEGEGYGTSRDYAPPEETTRLALYENGQETYDTYADQNSQQSAYTSENYQQNQNTYYGGKQYSRSDYENRDDRQANGKTQPRKKLSTLNIILIIILVGVLGGLFGVTVGLGGAGIGIFIGSLVCIGSGIFSVFAAPAEGFAVIGVGAILLAISIMLILLCVLLVFHWLPMLVKAIVKWVKGLRRHQEGGNEA